MAKRRPQLVDQEVKYRMSDAVKELLLLYLVQLPTAREIAIAHIQPYYFERPDDDVLLMLWGAVQVCHKEHPGQITRPQLEAAVLQYLEETPDAIDRDEQEGEWQKIFKKCTKPQGWTLEQQNIETEKALKHLQRFVEEGITRHYLETMSDGSLLPDDLQAAAREHQIAMEAAATITISHERDDIFSEDAEERIAVPVLTPTDISFIDAALDGGDHPGAVYALVGPTGGGKTILCTQLGLVRVHWHAQEIRTEGSKKPPKIAYYFSYEVKRDEFFPRAMCFISRLHAKELKAAKKIAYLSDVFGQYPDGSPNQDELDEYHAQVAAGEKPLSARKRAKAWRRVIGRGFRFVSLNEEPGVGYEGVPEIVRIIEADQRRRGSPGVLWVGIDHVMAMIGKYVQIKGREQMNQQQLIDRVPMDCSVLIASRFRCPVWLVHQAAGRTLSRAAGSKLHVNDTMGSKTFHTACYYAFHLGLPEKGGLTRFATVKARESIKLEDDQVIRLNGPYFRWESTNGKWSFAGGKISEVSDLKKVHGRQEEANGEKNPRIGVPDDTAEALPPRDDV